MALSIGEIEAVLKARDELSGVLIKAQKEIGKLGSEAEASSTRASSAFGGMGAAIVGALSVTAIVGFTKELLRMGDEIVKVADRTGMTTDQVQQFKFAAEQSGNTIEELTGAIGQMQNRLASGDSSALAALKQLGLSLDAIKSMGPADQFRVMAAAIGDIEDPMVQAQVAMDLFGRTGIALLPTLKGHFDDLANSAPKMSEATIKNLDAAGDSIDKLILSFKVAAAETMLSMDTIFIAMGQGAIQARATAGGIRDLTDWLGIGGTAADAFSAQYKTAMDKISGESKKAKKDVEDLIKPLNALQMAAKGLSPIKMPESLKAIALSASDLDAVYRDLDNTLKDNNETWKKNEEAAKRAKEEFKRLKDALYAIERQITTSDYFHTLFTDIDKVGLETDLVTDKFLEMALAFDEINRKANVALNYFKLLPGYMDQLGKKLPIPQMEDLAEAFGMTKDEFKKLMDEMEKKPPSVEESLRDLAQAFSFLGDTIGGEMGESIRWIGQLVTSMNLAMEAGKSMKAGWANMTSGEGGIGGALAGGMQMLQGGIAGAGALWQATSGKSTGKNVLGGMATGAAIGSMFGPIGTAIGAAIGALVGYIRSVIQSESEKITGDTFRDFGVRITEGLADAIEAEGVGRMDGALRHLGDIIQEAGGVTFDRLDFWTGKTRDMFSAIERGTMTTGQVGTQLDKIFPQLAAHIEETGGIASKNLIDIIHLANEFGVQSKAIDDFVKQQLGNAAGGLNAMFAGMQTSAANKAKKELDDFLKLALAQQAAMKAGGLDTTAIDAKIAKYIEMKDAIVGVFVQTEQQARGLGAAIVGTFGEMIARGMSFRDALAAVQPSIDIFNQQLVQTGLDGGAAFAGLAYLAQVAADPITGPLLDAITGVDGALKGLHNSGILNQEMFAGLAATATQAYDQLIAQGVNADAALMLMQPTLQTIWQLQQDFGYEVDESTQKLIDQGVAAGMVGAQFRPAADKMVLALDKVVAILEKIATAFGVEGVEGAAEGAKEASVDAGTKAESAADDARLAVEKWDGSFVDLQDRMDALDPAPIYVIKQALEEAAAAADTLNFGHSPGGLKEIPLLLERGAERARAFASVMADVSDGAMDGIDGMTGEMEALIQAIGLMYAFAKGDFADFLVGDEKKLKEAGLFDFWKQWREQMRGATDDAHAFATVMADVTDSAVDGLSEMTGEMEEVIAKLGLMYAFAKNFEDFEVGDEKRLKEAGLYEFWKNWQEQFFGGGESGGGEGGGDVGRMPTAFGSPRVDQTIVINLDGAVIARQVMRDLPRQVQMYTR